MASIRLPDESASIRAAREFVRDALRPHSVEALEPLLVTSELATNVVRHAHTPFTVTVEISPGRVRIEVLDGAGAQAIATDLAQDEGGLGLRLVESLAGEWGVEIRGADKAVWVEIPTRTADGDGDGA